MRKKQDKARSNQATSSAKEVNVVGLLPGAVEEAVIVIRRSAPIDWIRCIDAQMDPNLQPEGIESLLIPFRQCWQKALVIVAGHKDLGHVGVGRDVCRRPHAGSCPNAENAEQWELEGLDLQEPIRAAAARDNAQKLIVSCIMLGCPFYAVCACRARAQAKRKNVS